MKDDVAASFPQHRSNGSSLLMRFGELAIMRVIDKVDLGGVSLGNLLANGSK